MSPTLAGRFFTTSITWEPRYIIDGQKNRININQISICVRKLWKSLSHAKPWKNTEARILCAGRIILSGDEDAHVNWGMRVRENGVLAVTPSVVCPAECEDKGKRPQTKGLLPS